MRIFTLFFKRGFSSIVALLLLLNVSAVFAQNITVTGTVTLKEDASTLPGIAVTVKGTTQGTLTDGVGKFSISAPTGATLVFTGVGFQTREVAVNGSTMSVVLETQQNNLNEVLVIGYGTTTRQNVTTAVTKIDPKKVPQAANSNIQQLLFGRAAGVQVSQSSPQPGGGINVSIRGRGNPLYVVDGVIFPGDALEPGNGAIARETNGVNRAGLAGLNPEDIESIEVLKDASAAIYGVNAANGVVLITTKKGKSGSMSVNYNGNYSFQKNYQYLQPLNATQYMTLFNQLSADYTVGNKPAQFSAAQIAAAGEGTKWLDEIFKTGAIHNHQLTVNGGTEKVTYYFSGGFYNEEGTLRNAGLTRYTGRSNLSFNISKHLTLNTNFTGSRNSYLNSSSGGQSGGSGAEGFGAVQAALGYPAYIPVRNANGGYSQFGLTANPVSLLEIKDRTYTSTLNANISADIKIIPGVLTVHGLYGNNYESSDRDFFVPSTVYYYQRYQARGSRNFAKRQSQTMEATIDFKKDFFDNRILNVSAIAGIGQYKNTYDAFGAEGGGGPDAFENTNLLLSTANMGINSGKTATKLRSYFGRATFSLYNKYLLTATARYDGFSLFFPENKYALFPSVSAGWKISSESFMENIKFISLLKLRGSIGLTGSTAGLSSGAGYGGYSSDGNILYFNNGAVNYPTIAAFAIDHPELTWQKTNNKNIGLDFGFFNDRITGSFDVFKDDITNLLRGTGPTPRLSPFSSQPVNGGHQVRQGYDVALNTQNLHIKNFDWSSVINLSHYTYKWKERFVYDILSANGGVTYQSVDDAVNEWYYIKTNGILQAGQAVPASQPTAAGSGARLPGAPIFVDVNNDGKLTGADVYKLNPDPKLILGFGNNFRYKQLDLSIFFYGQFGGKATNFNYAWADPVSLISNTQSGTIQALEVYTSANTGGTRPGVNYNETSAALPAGSDINMVSTNFVRCRNLTLGYTFNPKFISKFSKSIRVFADAQNLFIITDYKGVDPEVSYANVKGGYAPYPMFRTFSFGVRAGF
ncbi:SusC/RagA family TonB-linked outer membrane protein [Mucilaginibacter sp. PAMB04274]|uniref:SusC/RagA family TonB-linked outer membrane protein n=1 Tax=Mucilaginibacter sp. PAMB04274 TaxID=3138568 RepID=UPI0031F61E43